MSQPDATGPTVWLDADGVPRAVRDLLLKACDRRGFDLVLVANRWLGRLPARRARAVLVSAGADVADDHIVENCAAGDLVITADVPLAARVVERGAQALRHRGQLLTEANVGEALSVRDFADDLRSEGFVGGGPPPYNQRDRQAFANSLDRWLTRNL